MNIDFDVKQLAALVEQLLNEQAQELKKELLKKRMESDDFIKDVHEAHIDIDPASFKIISSSTTDQGDTIIEWETAEYVTTESTVDEPYKFEKRGRLLLKVDGHAELLR